MASKLQHLRAWGSFGNSYLFGKVRIWYCDLLIFHELTQGSIYKLLWANMTVYLVLYFALSFIYRFFLDEHGRVRHKTKIASVNNI